MNRQEVKIFYDANDGGFIATEVSLVIQAIFYFLPNGIFQLYQVNGSLIQNYLVAFRACPLLRAVAGSGVS